MLASVSENALASSSLEPHDHEIIVSENALASSSLESHDHEIIVSENELEPLAVGPHGHDPVPNNYTRTVYIATSTTCYKVESYEVSRCRVCLQDIGTPKLIGTNYYSGHSYSTSLVLCDMSKDAFRTTCRTCSYVYETIIRDCIHK